jgi:hypothetical protein
MPSPVSNRMRLIVRVFGAIAFALLLIGSAEAQSADVRFPTAIRTNEIAGTIAARDIGDSRLTDHFYTFNGAPGDLLITVESKNLNGDLDIFTATELRPLLKVTVYPESTSPVAKNIYLRKPESLILRVEARSPNDDAGSYRIRFGGSFVAVSGGPLADESGGAEANKPAPRSGDKKVSRVSSAGARIDEPPGEVAAAPTPTPEEIETPKPAPKPTPRATARRGRVPVRGTRSRPAAETTKKSTVENSEGSKQGSDTEEKAEPEKKETPTNTSETPKVAATENKPRPVRKNTTRRNPGTTPATKPAAGPAAESGPRLVIEVKDGTRIEYFMSRVRRVTVENGQVVVVSTNGKIERVAMVDVVRMSIGP